MGDYCTKGKFPTIKRASAMGHKQFYTPSFVIVINIFKYDGNLRIRVRV